MPRGLAEQLLLGQHQAPSSQVLSRTRSGTTRFQPVRQARPACVVFYSTSRDYLEAWSQIAGCALADVEPELMVMGNQDQRLTARFLPYGGTLFVNSYHTGYRGLTKQYFRAVGNRIRACVGLRGGRP